jgi:hypothetical protein
MGAALDAAADAVVVALVVASAEAVRAGDVCVAEAEPALGGADSPPSPPHANTNTPDTLSAPTTSH